MEAPGTRNLRAWHGRAAGTPGLRSQLPRSVVASPEHRTAWPRPFSLAHRGPWSEAPCSDPSLGCPPFEFWGFDAAEGVLGLAPFWASRRKRHGIRTYGAAAYRFRPPWKRGGPLIQAVCRKCLLEHVLVSARPGPFWGMIGHFKLGNLQSVTPYAVKVRADSGGMRVPLRGRTFRIAPYGGIMPFARVAVKPLSWWVAARRPWVSGLGGRSGAAARSWLVVLGEKGRIGRAVKPSPSRTKPAKPQ